MAERPKLVTRERTVEQKARVLAEASKLDGHERTAYLEREGVSLVEYQRWRIALDEGGRASASTTERIRQLERELARKKKALAEAAALLVLKKVETLFEEDEDDDTNGGRRRAHRCLPPSQVAGSRRRWPDWCSTSACSEAVRALGDDWLLLRGG